MKKILNFFYEDIYLTIKFKCRDIKYAIKYFFYPRNVIKIETLNRSWHDKDEMLLHGMFQLLVDFVEKERPGEIVNWNSDLEHKGAWEEIAHLYCWWKYTRPNRHDPVYDVESPPMKLVSKDNGLMEYHEGWVEDDPRMVSWKNACKESWRLEELWEREDHIMMHRLVNIHKYLWI